MDEVPIEYFVDYLDCGWLSGNAALPWSIDFIEHFAENWKIDKVDKVAEIYGGIICNLSREQVIRLLETLQQPPAKINKQKLKTVLIYLKEKYSNPTQKQNSQIESENITNEPKPS